MAYRELIKNFNLIRDYLREFYIYGFKSRGEYTRQSARSYDNERRRAESWLGEFMQAKQSPAGKQVFLSVDSRLTRRNPLYRAWKSKSFTDGDITLHFLLLDLLYAPQVELSLREITEQLDLRLTSFPHAKTFDVSTVRKKLNEYIDLGLLTAEKRGKEKLYRRTADRPSFSPALLHFFSEVAPCGVIGSYLLDRAEETRDLFAFKHHYMTSALDSDILCSLFLAMSEKRSVTLSPAPRRRHRLRPRRIVPLRILISVRHGRHYLAGYDPKAHGFFSFRLDQILFVRGGEVCENYDALRQKFDGLLPFMWGISTKNGSLSPRERAEFSLELAEGEEYLFRRLEREKRGGHVERESPARCRFTADVPDAGEMVPWIRSFIGRISSLSFSDRALETQFRDDLRAMYALYGIEEEPEA